MSRRANPTVVGIFVIGATVLMIAGVLILGGGNLFVKARTYVAFFEGSVYGLNVGAPVSFRGVRLGSVTGVEAFAITEGDAQGIQIQVTLEIQQGLLREAGGSTISLESIFQQDPMDFLVDEWGLRATLAYQSFLTSQLFVDLDFYPGTAIRRIGLDSPYPEVPTIETGLQKLTKKIETLPFDQIAAKLLTMVDALDRLLNAPELMETVRNANETVEDLQRLVRNVNERLAPLLDHLIATTDTAQAALLQAEKTLALEEGVSGELASNLAEATRAATAALAQARKTLAFDQGVPGRMADSLITTTDATGNAIGQAKLTLATVEDLVADKSPLRRHLLKTLDELAAAARSLRLMADYLQRHPEALLRGKRR